MKIVNKRQGLTNRELATVFMHPKFDGGHSKPLFYNIIVFVSNPAWLVCRKYFWIWKCLFYKTEFKISVWKLNKNLVFFVYKNPFRTTLHISQIPCIEAIFFNRAQFHQRTTYCFYARRSQKHKKILLTWVSIFCAFGIYVRKSCTLNVDEIESRSLSIFGLKTLTFNYNKSWLVAF